MAATVSAASAQDRSRAYVRGAVGYEAATDTRLADRACDAAPLLNFFGCQPGEDGEPIGARGNFGESPGVELAAGLRALRYLPVEVALSIARDSSSLVTRHSSVPASASRPRPKSPRPRSWFEESWTWVPS